MNAYFGLKVIHIISATVLFGTGLGTAFFKWMVDRTGNVAAIRVVSEKVVAADWLFTSPAIVVQAVTGFALAGTPACGSGSVSRVRSRHRCVLAHGFQTVSAV